MRRPLLTLLLVAALPTVLAAHHILGIPHYKYGDTYPQIPYLEVIAQVGSTDLDFTYFPGIPRPGERVRFKLYVHDRETGEVFREPLQVAVVRTSWLGDDQVVARPFEIKTGVGPEGNDYKFFLTFEAAEAYQIRVSFPNGDQVEVIPFPVVIGQTDDRPLIIGAVGVLGLTVVVVGIVKRRRQPARQRAVVAT
ncbi:MAG: hypothetical protein QF681_11785 [Vicinamibacterales bacterium]|jgi:hypothetical protein|nr:hypothetical protein [Vicinamibacterales bacterium]